MSLPFEINKSKTVTAEALQSLYRASERGQQGAFPLGAAAQFHCGTDLLVERGKPICSIAHGEVVAARIGFGPGEHPWGDTGFVLLRHPLGGNKSIFSLYVHLQREPLHPDRAAGWLRRLLLQSGEPGKPKWRVMADSPTWKDEDKGKFSRANVQKDKLLNAGVYEEEDRIGENNPVYLKLNGQWVEVAQNGTAKVKELSPWAGFDLEEAAKKSQTIAALKDGKVAILDADKKDGKRRWTVEAGEPIGLAGNYLGRPLVHWSVFSKEAAFPTGSLPKKEFGAKDEVKLSEVELNEERGDIAHTKKLIEALDPQKKTIGKMPHHIPMPGEVELFYRTPAECWRSRYLAVKGLTEFALDVDKYLQQERHKSHTDKEREEFKKNAQVFLFWKDLAKADEFPEDGKAIFVHPATALRLMPKSEEIHAQFVQQTHELDMEGEPDPKTVDEQPLANMYVCIGIAEGEGRKARLKILSKAYLDGEGVLVKGPGAGAKSRATLPAGTEGELYAWVTHKPLKAEGVSQIPIAACERIVDGRVVRKRAFVPDLTAALPAEHELHVEDGKVKLHRKVMHTAPGTFVAVPEEGLSLYRLGRK
jgi:hypothetical protein